jgi:hypothetical protein
MANPGGGDPANGPPDGALPGLPPAWGSVVIPDDLTALADEVALVRAELRGEARRRRRRRWTRRFIRTDRYGRPAVRLPALLLILAVLATLTGLFTLGYGGGRRGGAAVPVGPGATQDAPARPREVPALDLLDTRGQAVSLRSLLPAVILLTDGCACDALVTDTATAAPSGVNVIVVRRTATPPPTAAGPRVTALADPAGELRTMLGLPAGSARAAVLVADAGARIRRTVPTATAPVDLAVGWENK